MADFEKDKEDKADDVEALKKAAAELNKDPTLAQTIAELGQLLQPLSNDAQYEVAFYYLLLLWSYFQVYPLEPEQDYTKAESVVLIHPAKITQIEQGLKIFDYGYCLATSIGEFYGTTSTGRIIEAAQRIVRMLAERGITRVAFSGHPIAQRAAWIECMGYGIDCTFDPTNDDWEIYRRIIDVKARVALANENLNNQQRNENS